METHSSYTHKSTAFVTSYQDLLTNVQARQKSNMEERGLWAIGSCREKESPFTLSI